MFMMAVFCFECDKIFANQSSYNRHVREVHKNKSEVKSVEYQQDVCLYKCLDGCEISFKYNADLRKHLDEKHNIGIEIEEKKFAVYEDFLSWLQLEEKNNNVRYQKSTGTKKCGSKTIERTYYDCVRSGRIRSVPEAELKRSIKVQGSSKLNSKCTSQIILTKCTEGCSMVYFKKHYGHSADIQHLRLSKLSKQQIASKLMMGVSTQHIIDSTRENMQEHLNRDDLLNKDDIKNIKNTFNIHLKDGYRHPNDAVSVDLWVKEMRQGHHNPIVFYKKQNEVSSLYQNLRKEDFCLILMNNVQKDLLQKFGNKIICVDSTHGLNPYDFEVTTILVLDEFGEGFPTAFMFSNRKDTFIMVLFFEEIKNIVGIIQSDVFMTDITNVFCNAWQKVMGPPMRELFCSWHVDRAWQQNLSKVSNKDTRSWIYKTLKFLQTLPNIEEFEKGFESFLSKLKSNEQTKSMYSYLASHYANNVSKWAYCYRKNCFINTNMHIESMHKVIKYVYLNGRKVRRLDKSLNALHKFIRDKIIDRINKITKGKSSDHTRTISNRHRSAICSKFLIQRIDDTTDILKTETGKEYLIHQTSVTKCCNLLCNFCSICVHMYECTCTDFFMKHTICVHIHYVCMQTVKSTNLHVGHTEPTTEIDSLVQEVNKTSVPNANSSDETLKNEILGITSQISAHIKTKPVEKETMKLALTHLRTAALLISNEPSTDVNFKTSNTFGMLEPGNKNIEKQEFFSTKKKHVQKNRHIKKPSENEKTIIKEYLNTSLCISSDPNDHTYT